MRVASAEPVIRPLRRFNFSGAWNPSTARRVTQMRFFGIVLSTSVQAERHGPSIIIRSDARSCAKICK
jgi:hypothetical protein